MISSRVSGTHQETRSFQMPREPSKWLEGPGSPWTRFRPGSIAASSAPIRAPFTFHRSRLNVKFYRMSNPPVRLPNKMTGIIQIRRKHKGEIHSEISNMFAYHPVS
jgi:hypothetical protein